MAYQTTEKTFVHSTDSEFRAILNYEVREQIEDILHDALRDKGWDGGLTIVGWKASFEVTVLQETYEDEE